MKYSAIHELGSCHGVDLGQSYATKDCAKSFTHYIAESQHNAFMGSLSTAHFYSFIMDGTTDAGNVEDELIVIMSFRKDDTTGEVGTLLGISASKSLRKLMLMVSLCASSKHYKLLESTMC